MLHHCRVLWVTAVITYPKYGWIVGHLLWRGLVFFRWLFNTQIFYIATPEDDVVEFGIHWLDFVISSTATAFCAMRGNILEGYGGVFGVDFVKRADIPESREKDG